MRYRRYMYLFAIAWLLPACKTHFHTTEQVEAAMQYYNHLIEKTDADSIALLYTADGNLGNIAVGRDSIRKFLMAFKNVKVLSQTSTSALIKITRDTAVQKGNYVQKDVLPGNDTIVVKGAYTANWLWVANEGWRIKKMETIPVK